MIPNRAGSPSICRNCGSLVAAGENICAQCDQPLATSTPRRAGRQPTHDSATINFARAVLTRPAPFTTIFLVANVFVFLLVLFSGGGEDSRALIAYGAKVNALIDERGEWWRFVTPIFLHSGLLHLLFNMYGLWAIGPYVERLYGSAKFVVFWVLTGVAGVVASYLSVRPDMHVGSIGRFLFKAEDVPSVGASGALFGLVGVLFVFGIKFRRELPEGFKRAFGTGMLPIIAINLVIGFLGRGFIDNAAHLGGLAAGAVLALLVDYKRPGERGPLAVVWHVLQIAALALIVLSFFMVWRHYSGTAPTFTASSLQRGFSGSGNSVRAHIDAVNEGTVVFVRAFNEGDLSGVGPAVNKINDAPPLDNEADALRNELKLFLERVRDAAITPGGGGKPAPSAQRAQLLADFQSWHKRNEDWVKTAGQKYGLKVVEEPQSMGSPSK